MRHGWRALAEMTLPQLIALRDKNKGNFRVHITHSTYLQLGKEYLPTEDDVLCALLCALFCSAHRYHRWLWTRGNTVVKKK